MPLLLIADNEKPVDANPKYTGETDSRLIAGYVQSIIRFMISVSFAVTGLMPSILKQFMSSESEPREQYLILIVITKLGHNISYDMVFLLPPIHLHNCTSI